MSPATYGACLDDVAVALARARVGTRHAARARNLEDAAAAAHARSLLYHALQRQVVVITRGTSVLADALGAATTTSDAMIQRVPPTIVAPYAQSPTAQALRQAADTARIAADILATHLPTNRWPQSPDGDALLVGLGRSDNLARLARLAHTAGRFDRVLSGWLSADQYLGGLRADLVAAASLDAARTHESLCSTARSSMKSGDADQATALALTPLPDLDQYRRVWAINDHADCIAAIDATRAWLMRHHRSDLTSGELTELCRTSLSLTLEIGYLLLHGTGDERVRILTTEIAKQWQCVAGTAGRLRTAESSEERAGPTALAAAERWLRKHLRDGAGWRSLNQIGDVAVWQDTARAALARLPDLATMVHLGAEHLTNRRDLLVVTGLQRVPGHPVDIPAWSRAASNMMVVVDLRHAARHLRDPMVRLAAVINVPLRPGLSEIAERRVSLFDQAPDTPASRPRARPVRKSTRTADADIAAPHTTVVSTDQLLNAVHALSMDIARLHTKLDRQSLPPPDADSASVTTGSGPVHDEPEL